MLGGDTTLLDAFKAANDVLQGAVQGIADLITRPGLINVDFADVRTVMSEMGMAMMGSGTARGENRARAAAEAAISSPLLEDVNLSGAHGILVNVTAGMDLAPASSTRSATPSSSSRREDATVVIGTVLDPDMTDRSASPWSPRASAGRPPCAACPPRRRRRGSKSFAAVRAGGRSTNYADYDQPSFRRRPARRGRRTCVPTPRATTRTWTSRRSCAGKRLSPHVREQRGTFLHGWCLRQCCSGRPPVAGRLLCA